MVQKSGRAPVEVGSFSHYLQGFFTSQVVSRISEPSTVLKIPRSSWKVRQVFFRGSPPTNGCAPSTFSFSARIFLSHITDY